MGSEMCIRDSPYTLLCRPVGRWAPHTMLTAGGLHTPATSSPHPQPRQCLVPPTHPNINIHTLWGSPDPLAFPNSTTRLDLVSLAHASRPAGFSNATELRGVFLHVNLRVGFAVTTSRPRGRVARPLDLGVEWPSSRSDSVSTSISGPFSEPLSESVSVSISASNSESVSESV